MSFTLSFFFFQAEEAIGILVRSRGLGDVYKGQTLGHDVTWCEGGERVRASRPGSRPCPFNTSDAAEQLTRVESPCCGNKKKKNNEKSVHIIQNLMYVTDYIQE